MKKYSLGALVAAGLLVGGLSAGSASAADLGGNCCADLEERIAELEATTARKGNRKVSLTISGWVAEQVMYWDDGDERTSTSAVSAPRSPRHFKFTGQATISPGWYAGYVIHVEADGSDSLTDQRLQDPAIGSCRRSDRTPLCWRHQLRRQTLQSFWFIKSDHLGKLCVGLQSQASDNTAILVDGSGSLVPANWVAVRLRRLLHPRNSGTLGADGVTWGMASCRGMGGLGGDCNGLPQECRPLRLADLRRVLGVGLLG